jgi:hypothetical protein
MSFRPRGLNIHSLGIAEFSTGASGVACRPQWMPVLWITLVNDLYCPLIWQAVDRNVLQNRNVRPRPKSAAI